MTDDTQNTTDATRGQQLRQRVEARRAELEAARASIPEANTERGQVEFALAELSTLMTGDLENIPHMVARELSRWLENNKHVSEHHASSEAQDATVLDEAAVSPAATDSPA